MAKKITTVEKALTAVRQDGMTLEYVPENLKTAELCLEAVKQDGTALQYVPLELRTAKLCLEAVDQQYGMALQYVPENLKTVELCLKAAKRMFEKVLVNFLAVPEELLEEVRRRAGLIAENETYS